MYPERILTYTLIDLETGPAVMAALLEGLTAAEADYRPDPDRFTLREVVCHVADWDEIFTGRIVRTLEDDQPILHGIDEGQMAIDRRYGEKDWNGQFLLLAERRAQLVDLLRALPAEAWERVGRHGELGPITVQDQTALVGGHDGYHIRQILEWRRGYRERAQA